MPARSATDQAYAEYAPQRSNQTYAFTRRMAAAITQIAPTMSRTRVFSALLPPGGWAWRVLKAFIPIRIEHTA